LRMAASMPLRVSGTCTRASSNDSRCIRNRRHDGSVVAWTGGLGLGCVISQMCTDACHRDAQLCNLHAD
jgi:hypothetical protein